jgi:glutamate---cysteine ligase / carboxylate-amine ligase
VDVKAIDKPVRAGAAHAEWAHWHESREYTVGIEEEVMLLDPQAWSLADKSEQILARLPTSLGGHATGETHQATVELRTSVHTSARDAGREAADLRRAFSNEVAKHELCAASAGTHPSAVWTDTRVSRSARYQLVHESMRELARREPTFALHVHVGVNDPDRAIALQNRLRTHLPLLLALSGNSPFWQGRSTGLSSTRTPIFQAFPRVGVPRAFRSYDQYVEAVDQLLRVHAFPTHTFLWWDVRPQPGLGTVEVRVMDAQTTSADSGALAALVLTIAHLELEEGYAADRLIVADEVIHENRFLAARDGMHARFIDPVGDRRISAKEALEDLLRAGQDHADDLGCEIELEHVRELALETGAEHQLRIAREYELEGLVQVLADEFVA